MKIVQRYEKMENNIKRFLKCNMSAMQISYKE